MKFPAFLYPSLALFSVFLPAQDAPDPAAAQGFQLNAIGASAAQAVYATHMAVNTLSDAWFHKAYTDEVALALADGYGKGLGEVTASLSRVVDNVPGLSPEDLKSLSGLVESGALVIEQVAAFQDYVKSGEPAKAQVFEQRRVAAQERLFAVLGIGEDNSGGTSPVPTPGGGPGQLHFEIVSGTLPDGGPGQKGKVRFSRTSPDHAYTVAWTYDDGSADEGLAVAYPDSGVIAVGFGPDVLGVAIYRIEGDQVQARWAPYQENAKIEPYTMTKGENESVYRIEIGGITGTFHFEEMDNDTSRLAWRYADGTLEGYGVASGNYLAAVSVKPGGKSGVAIYVADPENDSAEGKWTLESTLGTVGRETYRFLGTE